MCLSMSAACRGTGEVDRRNHRLGAESRSQYSAHRAAPPLPELCGQIILDMGQVEERVQPARNLKLVPSEESARGHLPYSWRKTALAPGLPAWVINTCSNRTQGSCDQTFPDNETLLEVSVPLTETLSLLAAHSTRGAEPADCGELPQPPRPLRRVSQTSRPPRW